MNIPCAFFCLPNKDYTSYKRIFECLANKGAGSPDRIHMDFEPGALRAVRECRPSSEIIGCDFHFKKCICENIQKLGLMKVLNEYEEFQTFHHYLWALSHVTIDRVQQVWDDFIVRNVPMVDEEELDEEDDHEAAHQFNDLLQQFVLYFENTWVGGKNLRNPSQEGCLN